MSERFITFMPVTGIFEQAIKPYKKWYELADMSPWIEVDGEHYRILRTTGRFNKFATRKGVICDERGELIKDENITRACFKIMQYLNTISQGNSSSILAWENDDRVAKLDEFITEFKKIIESIAAKLENDELTAMKSQLDYYKKMKCYSAIIAKEATILKTYIQLFQDNQIDSFSSSFINKLKSHITTFEMNKDYSEAAMIESGSKTRKIVRKILTRSEFKSYFSNYKLTEKMVNETFEADRAVIRLSYDGKLSWEREVYWANPDKGKFTMEKYTDDLKNRNNLEVFTKVNENEFIKECWVFY